ncbi:MAG: hypothetical protein JJU21_13325, partial [Salinarimonas sp.]|nr:hypothetical protein [Salinarimonas sp.]
NQTPPPSSGGKMAGSDQSRQEVNGIALTNHPIKGQPQKDIQSYVQRRYLGVFSQAGCKASAIRV